MKYTRAIEYAISELKEKLPMELTYHSLQHTLSVMELAREIGKEEGLSEEEMHLVSIAAAFHDIGFTRSLEKHEEESCKVAEEILPELGFDTGEVERIKEMIMSTKLPQSPSDKLSEVLCDADLGYIGKNKYFEIAHGLYEELAATGNELSNQDWIDLQIRFLENQSFFTPYAQKTFDENKKNVIVQLRANQN